MKKATTSHVAPRQRSKRARGERSPGALPAGKAIPEPQTGSETGRAPQHPEDRARDARLEADLRENAESPLDRHRGNLTGVEHEEDGVPEDVEDLEAAMDDELADQQLRDRDHP